MASVGLQQCLDQRSLLLTQLLSCLLCPPLGLLCPSQGQSFCRQDHCAQEGDVTELLRPAESTFLSQPLGGTPHILRREGCGMETSRGLCGLG